MHRLYNDAPGIPDTCKECKGTRECKQVIQSFIHRKATERLKELLPTIFDASRIYVTDTQMRILRDCSLTPTLIRHRVTFLLPAEPSSSPLPAPSASSSPLPTPSASSRSWPSSEENESD